MNPMTLEGFIEITVEFLYEHGGEEYLPTIIPLCQPERPLMLVRGIPDEIDHRDAIQQVITDAGLQDSEFYFCVKSGDGEWVGGRYTPEATEFFAIRKSGEKFIAGRIPGVPWWRVGRPSA
jgi:MoaA/NifB/PqqE/SkfB family radical SAM enzyme